MALVSGAWRALLQQRVRLGGVDSVAHPRKSSFHPPLPRARRRDNRYSDGGHYGRAPWHRNKGGKKVGAAHFVDVMYIHVLLNLLCPAATSTAGGSGSGEA